MSVNISATRLRDLLLENTQTNGPDYVAYEPSPFQRRDLDPLVVAYYLPQFHATPENDIWWGRGFTEWTNVSKSLPQFTGHYQPHLPGELGFYDLDNREVLRRQMQLARHYGISAFCYHYYWFNGRRVLTKPLEHIQADPTLDLPYCLCWANENWTRRWDGADQEVLLAQNHSPEDDIAFIEAISTHLDDPRYLRINGQPLLIVYRPSLMPDPRGTAERWRNWRRERGLSEPLIAMAQTFDVYDPREVGFDLAVEFPPHNMGRSAPCINRDLQIIHDDYQGHVVPYRFLVEYAERLQPPDFPLIRAAFPSWDNEARKPGRGYTWHGSTPALFRRWLTTLLGFAKTNPVKGQQLTFINAWNEWGEGAHLEPDRRFGYAYLSAVREALIQQRQPVVKAVMPTTGRRLLLVGHDANPHGAQMLTLALAREFVRQGVEVEIALLGDGPMLDQFAKETRVHHLWAMDNTARKVFLEECRGRGFITALLNTTISGGLASACRSAGLHTITLIHEMPGILTANALLSTLRSAMSCSHIVVFPAATVRDANLAIAQVGSDTKIQVRPQGIYQTQIDLSRVQSRQECFASLGIPVDARLVIGAGYADFRKGVDLFLQCASDICLDNNVVHVLWVGAVDLRLAPYLEHEIQARKLEGRVRFTGFRNDLATILQFVDVFLQTSREDPFPSVVLEAMRAGVPVLAFRGAGGIDDLLNQGIGGFLIDRFDPRSMARACLRLLSEPEQRNAMGMAGKQLMNEHYIFDAYVADLIRLARLRPPNISVIVPNFNYLRYLRVRINSILTQTYPIHEIILLDDASTDGSKEELQRIADELRGKMSVLVFHNEINSGSVMDQWARGVAAATGDLVWIAEADDLADPDFASELARTFDDQDVLFSYAQSRQIDSDGNVLAENYHAYTDPIDPVHWHMDGLEGPEDLIRYHAIKNCIPNVSAVLFRRQGLLDAITAGKPYQVAGDWRCYLTLMEMGRVAFRARTLNSHRRHQASITGSLKAERHYREVVETQEWVLSRHPGAHVLKSAMMEYRKHLLDYLGLSHECDGSAS